MKLQDDKRRLFAEVIEGGDQSGRLAGVKLKDS